MSIAAWSDRIAILGVRRESSDHGTSALVAVILNKRGEVDGTAELPNAGCEHTLRMLAAGRDGLVAFCMGESTAKWFAIRPESTRLVLTQIGESHDLAGDVLIAVQAERHYWLMEHGNESRTFGSGIGLTAPKLARVSSQHVATGIAPYSGTDVLVCSTGTHGEIRITQLDALGREVRSGEVAGSRPKRDSARIFRTAEAIVLIWVEWADSGSWHPLAPRKSRLKAQRFSVNLEPEGAQAQVSEDEHVSHLGLAESRGTAVLFWNQGVRGPWPAASFVRLRSFGDLSTPKAYRFPNGLMPVSMTIMGAGAVAALTQEPGRGRDAAPDRIVVMEAQ